MIALPPLGIVLTHVLLSQLHGLAILGIAHTVDLDAAAALAVDAVRGGGVEDDQRAVLALAQADPDVAVHGEDVAGLEVLRLKGLLLAPSAPLLSLGEVLGLLGGGHDVALVTVGDRAIGGMHGVVDRPAHEGGAVDAAVVVLVPLLVGVVALAVVIIVLVGVVGVLALEEVDPALGQADGHGLVRGVHVLPVPGAAVDVQRGANGGQSSGQEVLQGLLAGGAGHRSLVLLGNKGLVDSLGLIAIDHNFNGVAYLDRGSLHRGAAGLGGDLIGLGICGVQSLAVHSDGVLADGSDLAHDYIGMALILQLNIGDLVGGHINVIDIAFHQLVLEAVCGISVHSEGADVAVYEELVLEGGLVVPVGIPVTVALDAQIYGLTVIGVKQVGQDLVSAHIGIAIRVSESVLQIPAELAGIFAAVLSVAVKTLIDLVIALPPLGIVLTHVLLSQLHGLAILGIAHTVDLDAAAALAVDAVRGGGVEDDQRAVLALAQADPDVAVHGEDVAGLEVLRLKGLLLAPSAPLLSLGEVLGLLGGGHDVALVTVGDRAIGGMHGVVDRPAHEGGAVDAAVVVLVPLLVGVVALAVVIIVLVGVVGVLALEEVDPALGQADGHGLVGGVHILPVPGAAVDVQGGAHGLHGGGQEVLQGQLAGHAADRGGVVLGNKHPEQLGYMVIRVYYDADGLILLELIKLDVLNSGPAGLGGDVIELGILVDRKGLIVHLDPPVAVIIGPHFGQDTGHIALFHLGTGDCIAADGDIVDVALLELVLEFELAAVGGNGKGLFMAIHKETVLKRFLLILGDPAIVLHSQVDSIVADGCPGGIP